MIELNNHFDLIKSIVCLNGEIPSKDFFTRHPNIPIIAADGAGNTLINMGIIPTLIVGDLDSIDRSLIPNNIEILCIAEQISTDCEKVLQTVKARELFPCLIYGATGKESDHTLYNLHVLADYSLRHSIIFHDSAYKDKEKYGVFVSDRLIGNLKIDSKISFFSFTHAIISSKGLRWELDMLPLSPTVSNTRNAIHSSPIAITVHSGNALVLFDY